MTQSDTLDKRDLKTVLEMLAVDVEAFDHVPYRFATDEGMPSETETPLLLLIRSNGSLKARGY